MVRVSEGGKQLAFTDERVARKRSNDIPTDTSVKPLEEHSFRPFHHLTSPINSPFKTLASPESGPRACTARLRHGVHVRGVAPNGATVRLKHGRFHKCRVPWINATPAAHYSTATYDGKEGIPKRTRSRDRPHLAGEHTLSAHASTATLPTRHESVQSTGNQTGR